MSQQEFQVVSNDRPLVLNRPDTAPVHCMAPTATHYLFTQRFVVKAFHTGSHGSYIILPPLLTIGDDVDARMLLLLDNRAGRVVVGCLGTGPATVQLPPEPKWSCLPSNAKVFS